MPGSATSTPPPPETAVAPLPAGALAGDTGLVRPGTRPPDVVAFENCVVSFFVDAADLLGVPKSVAAIYGICFASPQPLGFADIEERLDISKGSISQGVRVLREIGALKLADTQDRRDYFVPDLELRNVAMRFLEKRLERQLKTGRGRLETMGRLLPPSLGADGRPRPSREIKELKTRLRSLQAWHDKSRALVPVMKAFLKLT